ncbi:MAG: SCP2 sterol-binding domain-containing protein [Bdellovibrionales bacterium]
MYKTGLPATFARRAMVLMPRPTLNHGLELLMRRLHNASPHLFRNLSTLPRATILIEPLDLPHLFLLSLGQAPVTLELIEAENVNALAPSAHIKGKLKALLDLLDSHIDSDALFFTRALTLTGDTSVVVTLRNALERNPIDSMAAVASLFGPFAPIAKKTMVQADKAMVSIADALGQNPQNEFLETTVEKQQQTQEELRAEIDDLKSRLAKMEAWQRRKMENAA